MPHLNVVIADQAGFHLPAGDAKVPANLRLSPLPPYCPELNPVERFGVLLKAAVSNRLYLNLRKLEDYFIAAARPWSTPAAVAGLIHLWLADKASYGAPAQNLNFAPTMRRTLSVPPTDPPNLLTLA